MPPRNRCSAIKSLLLAVLLGSAAWVQAAPGNSAGTIAHLSGPLLVKKQDGSVRILGEQSKVEVGDTVSTQAKGYAQIRFSDDSLLTLQPDTVMTVDKYAYDAAAPGADEVVMTLRQGGLRAQPGKLAQRSKDRVTLLTPLASIGLQAGGAVVQYQPEQASAAITAPRVAYRLAVLASGLEASAMANDSPVAAFMQVIAARYAYRLAHVAAWLESWVTGGGTTVAVTTPSGLTAPALPPGLYVAVTDGQITLANKGGTTSFTAGQFGFTPAVTQPPVLVPTNPGMQFSPPPAFNASTSASSAASTAPKGGAVDCIVR